MESIGIDTSYIGAHYCSSEDAHIAHFTASDATPRSSPRIWLDSEDKIQADDDDRRLLERVGACSPVGEEETEANCLKDTGECADGDGVHGTLLGEDLGDELYRFIGSAGDAHQLGVVER